MGMQLVDAAEYAERSRFAVVDSKGQTRISASIPCEHPEETEEVAVALALTDPTCMTVICDSRQAVRNFAKRWVWRRVAQILRNSPVQRAVGFQTRLLWFPTHIGEVSETQRHLNEMAHAKARKLGNRASERRLWGNTEDRLTSYNEITKAFYLARLTFPPHSDKLNRTQAAALRQHDLCGVV
ncbi:hypothetical protein HPB52_003598 [Rhipicephalus sanguineus]|uniref:Tick transposon n=1 Tax=Rhipicephalus sanguineus TaxID=34632 RepID=A0A9D4QD23_RHISA|nr:hypothetical protein HPB52_003598 [Rhipicephalus sanguineus]